VSDKPTLRQARWDALIAAGASRFPGAKGRIPNFSGAEAAAEILIASPLWTRARTLKINPDSPQRPVRYAALKQGKRLFLPAPRLADEHPFIELDPAQLPEGSAWQASSIKGAYALGRPVSLAAMPPLDLIVTGCVGATRAGARLGKGGGYSDLEYAMLRERGCVASDTPIATTLHPTQLIENGGIPVEPHDISLDLIATPSLLIETGRTIPRPAGILWHALPPEKRRAIPALEALWRERQGATATMG